MGCEKYKQRITTILSLGFWFGNWMDEDTIQTKKQKEEQSWVEGDSELSFRHVAFGSL